MTSNDQPQLEAPAATDTNPLAALWAALIGATLLVVAFSFGSLVAATGLHDPDSCWLLASGRYIAQHLALPATDPFSYTFAGLHRPFVMYQWLTEVIYYLLAKTLGLAGLLTVCALFAVMMFLALPLFFSAKLENTRLTAILIAMLLVLAACFHVLIRPELFSYALISTWIFGLLLWRHNLFVQSLSGDGSKPSEQKFSGSALIWLLPGTMLLWANLHTGFTIGLSAGALTLIFYWLSYLVSTQKSAFVASEVRYLAIAILLAFASTLLNPHGLGLWQYLPALYFSPMNAFIDELKPIGLADLANPTYYPFILLGITAGTMAYSNWRLRKVYLLGKFPDDGIFLSVLNIAICFCAGLAARRMISFTSIVIAYEAIFLCYIYGAVSGSISPQPKQAPLWLAISKRLEGAFPPNWASLFCSLGVPALFGAYIVTARIVPPALPQGSTAVPVPIKAVQYLGAHKGTGNLFNDAQYGDILIWEFPQKIPVFIDTRFDMYGNSFVGSYLKMRFSEPGYAELLRAYAITDVFVPAKSPLANKLDADSSDWTKVYGDKIASIFRRVQK